MNQINFDYSIKNIPIPPKSVYTKQLIVKTESFLKRMRWKAFFFNKQIRSSGDQNFYGFPTANTPPQDEQLKQFELDMYELIKSIEFHNSNNTSQLHKKMKEDVKNIQKSNQLFVAADKTNNFYSMPSEQYNKLMNEAITKSYTKSNSNATTAINSTSKEIASKMKIADRVDCFMEKTAYITLKDHKEDFNIRPRTRLINPAKSVLGRVSKQILENINLQIKTVYELQQWKNTDEVVSWFKNIKDKPACKFLKFDIAEFYPSITKELLMKAINFAREANVTITQDDINLIIHTKESLLFNGNSVWKKKGTRNFDVTMGSYDGAEVCELVGLYILSKLPGDFGNVGLYRDDGLACIKNCSGPQADRLRKSLIKFFKSNFDLNITADTNLTCTDFLDVNLDLRTGNFFPYKKPNDILQYVNSQSNHPPAIIKEIPKIIQTRITKLSCDVNQFNRAIPPYIAALKRSGYNDEISFDPTPTTISKRRRVRKIIWYNPPFNKDVKTNVGAKFFTLLDKHFPIKSKLHKIFNRNTVKLSYSCMPNMETIINKHNYKILNPKSINNEKFCNCRNKDRCPLNGNCIQTDVVYKATCSTRTSEKVYYGTATNFKLRFNNHIHSFKSLENKHRTELSNYVHYLQDHDIEYTIKWSIAEKAKAYFSGAKSCSLCTAEKYHIMMHPQQESLLNKRSELLNKCRHKSAYSLKSFVPRKRCTEKHGNTQERDEPSAEVNSTSPLDAQSVTDDTSIQLTPNNVNTTKLDSTKEDHDLANIIFGLSEEDTYDGPAVRKVVDDDSNIHFTLGNNNTAAGHDITDTTVNSSEQTSNEASAVSARPPIKKNKIARSRKTTSNNDASSKCKQKPRALTQFDRPRNLKNRTKVPSTDPVQDTSVGARRYNKCHRLEQHSMDQRPESIISLTIPTLLNDTGQHILCDERMRLRSYATRSKSLLSSDADP